MVTNQNLKNLVEYIKTNYSNGCTEMECEFCVLFNLKPSDIVENHICDILRHLDSKQRKK